MRQKNAVKNDRKTFGHKGDMLTFGVKSFLLKIVFEIGSR
jgi:hypothetical protein